MRDPDLNALVAGTGVARVTLPAGERELRDRLVERASHDGAASLSVAERAKLLSDPLAMAALHRSLGTHSASPLAAHGG